MRNEMTAQVRINGVLSHRYIATNVGVERIRQDRFGYDIIAYWPAEEKNWTPRERISFFRDAVLGDDDRAEVHAKVEVL